MPRREPAWEPDGQGLGDGFLPAIMENDSDLNDFLCSLIYPRLLHNVIMDNKIGRFLLLSLLFFPSSLCPNTPESTEFQYKIRYKLKAGIYKALSQAERVVCPRRTGSGGRH